MSSHSVRAPKKLIEVALPLDAINEQAAREKSIRHGHPSTLHLWWARRPLAAARAVIFAQLVNDPSWKWEFENPGAPPPSHLKGSWAASRKRLFTLITELVKWENSTNEEVLEKARAEIRKSWREVCELNKDHPDAATLFDPERMPGLHDPFAGGGTIPLEAQRLGLEAYASDLNPVAVLINKAMIEIPPKFAGKPPVNPESRRSAGMKTWSRAEGLAEDVRYYGAWMREEAWKRIGHLYPPVAITKEMTRDREDLKPYIGKELTVIAWIWARTVKSPNPAFSHMDVPLVSSFILATKAGKEAWVEPLVERDEYNFVVRAGNFPAVAKDGTKSARGANFRCLLSNTPIESEYIRQEAQAGRMGARLLAVVAEGIRGRVYLSPTEEHEATARQAVPSWKPDLKVTTPCHDIDRLPMYGMYMWADCFTNRQLAAVTTFCDLVGEVRTLVHRDAVEAMTADDNRSFSAGGLGGEAYGDAIAVYMAFCVDRLANYSTTLCTWHSGVKYETITSTFGRHAIPMTWDYAEGNPFSDSSGNILKQVDSVAANIDAFPVADFGGHAAQIDARDVLLQMSGRVVSTDPPYYDNVGYADISDFFYIWLRRSLRGMFPELLSTIAVPKAEELIASQYRHGSKANAEVFFLNGMTSVMKGIASAANSAAPVTIFYAFKQSETSESEGTSSTGWETFLGAVQDAGLAITGTWPVRTEYTSNLKKGTNALASSIVLVCRKRPDDAPTATRRQFTRELNAVLPVALDEMTMGAGEGRSPVAPVDLSQAMIGPGMAVFSKYRAVLEADGTPMSVKTALHLINRFLADDDFDADTQFCLRWYEQHGWDAGAFGEADVLARAKGTAVSGLVDAGVVWSDGGKVRLRKQSEYPADWDAASDKRLPVWEALHQLIRSFRSDGERGAAVVLAVVKDKTEPIRQLAYRLYTLCERRGEAEQARGYNEIMTAWAAVERVAETMPKGPAQLDLFGGKS